MTEFPAPAGLAEEHQVSDCDSIIGTHRVLTSQDSLWYRLGGAAIMLGLSMVSGYAIRLLRGRK